MGTYTTQKNKDKKNNADE